jgi:hypothetical protein
VYLTAYAYTVKPSLEVTPMFASDPRDVLAVAHQHADQLRAEPAARRLVSPSGTRRALAASLRRVADRLDRAAFTPRPA